VISAGSVAPPGCSTTSTDTLPARCSASTSRTSATTASGVCPSRRGRAIRNRRASPVLSRQVTLRSSRLRSSVVRSSRSSRSSRLGRWRRACSRAVDQASPGRSESARSSVESPAAARTSSRKTTTECAPVQCFAKVGLRCGVSVSHLNTFGGASARVRCTRNASRISRTGDGVLRAERVGVWGRVDLAGDCSVETPNNTALRQPHREPGDCPYFFAGPRDRTRVQRPPAKM